MSKLTREIAQKQAKRLQANPMLAPQSDDGRREVVDCLMRHCQDEQHCADTMTAILDNALEIKSLTAEIKAAARIRIRHDQAPPGCDRCCIGEDLQGVMQYHSHVTGTLANGTTYAIRCTCPRGQWYVKCDEEHLGPPSPQKRKPAKQLERVDARMRAAGEE